MIFEHKGEWLDTSDICPELSVIMASTILGEKGSDGLIEYMENLNKKAEETVEEIIEEKPIISEVVIESKHIEPVKESKNVVLPVFSSSAKTNPVAPVFGSTANKDSGDEGLFDTTPRVWKASSLTVEFGDVQCIDIMKSKLKGMGAPNISTTVDFSGCNLVEGSVMFILQALKELNAKVTGLSEDDSSIAERYMKYKFYRSGAENFKNDLGISVGETVILSDNLFYNNEFSRVAEIQEVLDDRIRVKEYSQATFNIDSRQLSSYTSEYFFNDLYFNRPFLHRPVKEEREFIESVFISHKHFDYKFVTTDDVEVEDYESLDLSLDEQF